MLINFLRQQASKRKKTLALLIDPDKHSEESLEALLQQAAKTPGPDVILVGGSLVFNGMEQTLEQIKSKTNKPVFIFPGSVLQVSSKADGILLLSLISGRNPEFLIGHHVQAAPLIKKSGIEVIPTGYMLVNSGIETSVSYMSNTKGIPYQKNDIAIATAIAGEQLGLKLLYLEAGSGAQKSVSPEMIQAVKSNTEVPLIVGGGIRTSTTLTEVLNAGADMVVIGSAFELNPQLLQDLARVVKDY